MDGEPEARTGGLREQAEARAADSPPARVALAAPLVDGPDAPTTGESRQSLD